MVGERLTILSQLLQRESPILPGFVLDNGFSHQFLSTVSNERSLADDAEENSPQDLARHYRRSISRLKIPEVRLTAIVRAAQQLNTPGLVLQPFVSDGSVRSVAIDSVWHTHSCSCTPQALETAIKSVWYDFGAASSSLYWQKSGLDRKHLNLALLVRPLRDFYASGTIAIESDRLLIRANWGLEYSILWGDVETDEYYLERDFGQIVGRHLGHKNYGYRCQQIEPGQIVNNCLEAYLPSVDLAASYVLDAPEIAELYRLTQELLAQQPQVKYLVWSALKTVNNAPQFYWTQIDDRLKVNFAAAERHKLRLDLSTREAPLLSGIATSPGMVEAEVEVIPNLDIATSAITPGSILVTRAIEPQHLVLIERVRGIITEVGGQNSHAGIVARESHIPAIVNAHRATEILSQGDRILLDGDRGHVYSSAAKRTSILPIAHKLSKNILAPNYPIATKLMVNLSQPKSLAAVANLPIDGVGLLRSELMLAELFANQTLAQWQESFQRQFVATLTACLRQFGTALAPRPVFYRSLDLYAQAQNPVFGDRGTYSYIKDPILFDLELEALQTVVAAGNHNLKLLLPFVRSLEEFQFCYRRLQQSGLTDRATFEVWMMVEVPSAVVLLPEYIRAGVQGIAIGTNDLTQLMLGVDREQAQFSDRGLNANHPAMQKTVAKLIAIAHEHNIDCCICGRAVTEHPDFVDRLVQWGIDTISVEPSAVAQTYKAIARAEKRLLLKAINEGS